MKIIKNKIYFVKIIKNKIIKNKIINYENYKNKNKNKIKNYKNKNKIYFVKIIKNKRRVLVEYSYYLFTLHLRQIKRILNIV